LLAGTNRSLMKNIKYIFTLTLLLSAIQYLHAQEKAPDTMAPGSAVQTSAQAHLEPVVITIGKKNEKFVGKNSLIKAHKLSAFYFEQNDMDPADYKINRYFITIIPKGGGPGLQMDSYTDVFHDKVIDALRAAPAGSKVSFTNVKASSKNPKDNSIGLMPDMHLTLKED